MKKAFSLVALLLTGLFLLSSCVVTPSPTPTPTQTPGSSTTLTPIPTPTPTPTLPAGLSVGEYIEQVRRFVVPETGEPDVWEEGTMRRILSVAPVPGIDELPVRNLDDLLEYHLYEASGGGMTDGKWNTWLIYLNQNVGVDALLPVFEYENTGKAYVAAVYRVSSEGLSDALMSLCFENYPAYSAGSEISGTETWWQYEKCTFFPVTGAKRASDYAAVQVGDPIEKLCSIDPSVEYDLMWDKSSEGKIMKDYSKTYQFKKILTDGFVYVTYDLKTRSIMRMTFFSPEEGEPYFYGSFLDRLYS